MTTMDAIKLFKAMRASATTISTAIQKAKPADEPHWSRLPSQLLSGHFRQRIDKAK
jgi:hypothetical protein